MGLEEHCWSPALLVNVAQSSSIGAGCSAAPAAGWISHHGTLPCIELRKGGEKLL